MNPCCTNKTSQEAVVQAETIGRDPSKQKLVRYRYTTYAPTCRASRKISESVMATTQSTIYKKPRHMLELGVPVEQGQAASNLMTLSDYRFRSFNCRVLVDELSRADCNARKCSSCSEPLATAPMQPPFSNRSIIFGCRILNEYWSEIFQRYLGKLSNCSDRPFSSLRYSHRFFFRITRIT